MAAAAHTATTEDTITLRLPPDPGLLGVALLVVGGLGVRLNLTIESLEDLELAVESLLGCVRRGEEATLEVTIANGSVTAAVSPIDGTTVRGKLDEESEEIGLRRVLQTVADRVEVVDREGSSWLSIEKRVSRDRYRNAQ